VGLTCAEALVRERIKVKLGWKLTQGRLTNLSRPDAWPHLATTLDR